MIQFDISGIVALIARVQRLKVNMKKSAPAFKQAAAYVSKSVLENFRVGGRPPWLPHSKLTQALRGPGAKLLRDTGNLMRSITPFWNETTSEFGVSTAVPYARLMDKGGMSSPSEIAIAAHTRQATTSSGGWGAHAPGATRLYKKAKAVSVKAYTMHLGSKPVPARPFMILQKGDYPNLVTIMRDWVNKTLNG